MPLEQVVGSTAYFYHVDQLGSVRSITSVSGAPQQTYSYDPYGNTLITTGSLVQPFQFAGQYRDSESGLYYLRARYYDPATGQFISRDPAVATTRQPYSYTYDNPLNVTDPTGLGPEGFAACLSLLIPFVGEGACAVVLRRRWLRQWESPPSHG